MSESVRITIEEWAGDNGISLTDEQIKELAEEIDICREMEYVPNRQEDLRREENREIAILKNQVDMLERYLESKGYHVTTFNDRIERFFMRNYGDISASDREIFR